MSLARAIAQRHLAIVLAAQQGADFATCRESDQDFWLGVADEAVAAMERAGVRFIVTIPPSGEKGGAAC